MFLPLSYDFDQQITFKGMSKRSLRLITAFTLIAVVAVAAAFLASGEHLQIIARL